MLYMRLVKNGYARNLSEARELDSREVLQAFYYERYLSDYESAFWELNKP